MRIDLFFQTLWDTSRRVQSSSFALSRYCAPSSFNRKRTEEPCPELGDMSSVIRASELRKTTHRVRVFPILLFCRTPVIPPHICPPIFPMLLLVSSRYGRQPRTCRILIAQRLRRVTPFSAHASSQTNHPSLRRRGPSRYPLHRTIFR